MQTALQLAKEFKTYDLCKRGTFKGVYLSFHWFNEFWTLRFKLVTGGFELVTCRFELLTCRFKLVSCGFELVTFGFATHLFELVYLYT